MIKFFSLFIHRVLKVLQLEHNKIQALFHPSNESMNVFESDFDAVSKLKSNHFKKKLI